MTSDVKKWVSKCDRCLRRKANTTTSELVNIVSNYPLKLVSMDFLTLEPSKGYGNVLVITDHFTKYAVAIPTKNQTAKTTASAFYNEFIVKYGIPTKLHTDQGNNFESDLMKELCNTMGVKKTRTSLYHTMGNGCTERWNRTLLNMQGTLDPNQKSNWKDYVTSLTYAYNCTRHESTNYSPFELMFGRTPKLSVDSLFENVAEESKEVNKTAKEYVTELKERMIATQKIAKEHADKARHKQKEKYDKKVRASKLYIGDKVLLKIFKHDGKRKIADKFEQQPYEVVGQKDPDIPVYKLRSTDGVEKLVNRNHFLPFATEEKASGQRIRSKNTKHPKDKVVKDVVLNENDVTSEEDSDEDIVCRTYNRGDAHTRRKIESTHENDAHREVIVIEDQVVDEVISIDSGSKSDFGE